MPVAARSAKRPTRRRALPAKFLIVGAVLVVAVGYLVTTGLGEATAYYLTVGELRTEKVAPGQIVRVSGDVVPGSIVRSGGTVSFAIGDASGQLPVAYRGVVPDIFGDGIQVVVEGRPGADGTFQASTLLAKCPSKFESAPAAGGPS